MQANETVVDLEFTKTTAAIINQNNLIREHLNITSYIDSKHG